MNRETIETGGELAAIRDEIDQLKRENLCIRRFSALVCVIVTAFFSVAATAIPTRVSNTAGTGSATLGIDTMNVGRMTISNEGGTDVVEAFAKDGSGQIEVKTSSGINIWASDDIPSVSVMTGDSTGLLGDLDNDGDVDFTDFLVFAQNFGRSLAG